jgi:ATP-binding cassette subfamily B multidrug efflux pump
MERKYLLYTFLSPLTMVGEVVMETVIPYIMAKIIDTGIANRDIRYVLKTGLIMIGCACLSLACGVAGGRLSAVASQGFSHNLRRKLFAKVQGFSFGNVDKFSTASLVTRLTTDVTNTQNAYQMVIRMCARAPFMLIAGTVMACMINMKLASLFLIAIPVLAFALWIISSTAYPRFGVMLGKYDKMNSTIQENLIAIRVVKAFVRGKYEDEKFRKSADGVRAAQVHAEKVIVLLMPIMQIVVYVSMIAALWFGGNMIIAGTMKTGELVSFLTYVTQILMSLMMLGMIFVMLVLTRASVQRITEVLDEQSEIVSPENGLRTVADGSIDFDHVSFSYSRKRDNCVLSDIDIHIKSGQVVGIIGGTGSSKTTLVSLVPRLYDVLDGTVKVGGEDVRRYDLVTLRDSVAMVLQKNVLFSGTIKENLKWGNKNASDEEMTQACIASDADGFIRSFPKGYETEMGQGGVNVSGGQKQRICIARALLKKPKILILDDSTSAVDTATESRIREALRTAHPETTKIIIAQRISSVKDADVIFVLDDGRISGCGTHEQLLETNTIYREVYDSQQSGGDADIASSSQGGR